MTRYLNESQLADLLPMADAIAALDDAFRALAAGTAQVQPRQRVRLANTVLQVMPAGIAGAGVGLKAYAGGRGGIRFLFLLFDEETGRPVALFQADRLGQIRTGAASGLATKYMARDDARVLAVIGTGWQARSQLAAVCAVRPIAEVRCYGRDPERRAQFAREMSEHVGVEVRPVEEPRTAVDGADIVVAITTAREPVFDGAWLAPGTHVNAAGVNQAAKREIDATTVRRSGTIVVDLLAQAREECGDLIAAEREGAFRWEQAQELAAVVSGATSGRRDAEEITLFESQGIALEDVAVGSLVYRRAVERGVGVELEL